MLRAKLTGISPEGLAEAWAEFAGEIPEPVLISLAKLAKTELERRGVSEAA